jgi:hypothetical protein
VIKLEFSLEELNHILSLLGQLPFAQSNNVISQIVVQAEPQALALAGEVEKEVEEQ